MPASWSKALQDTVLDRPASGDEMAALTVAEAYADGDAVPLPVQRLAREFAARQPAQPVRSTTVLGRWNELLGSEAGSADSRWFEQQDVVVAVGRDTSGNTQPPPVAHARQSLRRVGGPHTQGAPDGSPPARIAGAYARAPVVGLETVNAEDRALLAQVATVNAEMGTIVQRLLANLDDTGGLRADDLRLLAQSLQHVARACQARAERVDADCLAAVESARHAGTP